MPSLHEAFSWLSARLIWVASSCSSPNGSSESWTSTTLIGTPDSVRRAR
jgi:hypothetical protein